MKLYAILFVLLSTPAFGQVQIVSLSAIPAPPALPALPGVVALSIGTPTLAEPDQKLGDSDCYCGDVCKCGPNCDCYLCPHKPAKKTQTVLKPSTFGRAASAPSGPRALTPSSPRPASKLPAVAWQSPGGSGSPMAPLALNDATIDTIHQPPSTTAATSRAGADIPPARPLYQAPQIQAGTIVCNGVQCSQVQPQQRWRRWRR